MKNVMLSVLAKTILELPYILIFSFMESIIISIMDRGLHWGIWVGMVVLNLLIVALCDLLDQLIEYLTT